MYQLDFKNPIHIYFIGIGGISMSGLAEILLDHGFRISGSDRAETPLTCSLEEKGATIFYGQKTENISDRYDLVVYTAAIRPDNPEYAEAQRLRIPLLSRADLLGQMMQNYRSAIAVSGTHGKTTTTSMIAHILLAAETDPTISVGGMLPAISGNIRNGAESYFLTEACEYTNSFLSFYPTLGIILNVEEDHLDFFKDLADIRNSFRKFAERIPASGALVINADIEDHDYFTKDLACRVITYSDVSDADYTAENICFDQLAHPSFDVYFRGKNCGRFALHVPGKHNVSNALAAIAAGYELGFATDLIQSGLASFTGTDRRFQYKGRIRGAVLIDDYAHHPTEIRATLNTAANISHTKIRCVFQPHTYSRTHAFLDDFADALSLADEVLLAEIYAARETNDLGISSADLAERISAHGTQCTFYPSFEAIEQALLQTIAEGDLIITMGAGNVYEIGEHLLEDTQQ